MTATAAQIEVNKANGGGVLVRMGDNAAIIRRNPHHAEQMTTIRFIRQDSGQLVEAAWSPLAHPFEECDRVQLKGEGCGWGTSVYLWLIFGENIPTLIPEPAFPEIRRFVQFLAACLDEHIDELDAIE